MIIKTKEKETQTLKSSKTITIKELPSLKMINALSILLKQKPGPITSKVTNQLTVVRWKIQKQMI